MEFKHYLYTVFTVIDFILTIVAVYHIVTSRRDPVGAVVWILFVIFFPVGGLMIYFLFGWTRFQYKITKYRNSVKLIHQLTGHIHIRQDKENIDNLINIYKKTVKSNTLLDSLNEFQPLFGNKIELLEAGDEAYPSMLKSIETARHNICIQSFIFADDNIGRDFAEILMQKARQGVETRILYDPIGSMKTNRAFWRKLRNAGVNAYSFGGLNLWKRKFRLNFRNHRKNMIIDGKIAFSGGLNIHDDNYNKYCANNGGSRRIQDYHFRIEGPAVADFQAIFATDWIFVTGEKLAGLNFFPTLDQTGDNIIRVIDSNPTNPNKALSFTLMGAIMHADKRIEIITPYFYPEQEILSALKYAGISGVEVNIILPQINEHRIVGYAAKSLYRDLLECKINIFERRPPFIHSKSMIIDDEWAILGSANFDYISLRSNYELCFEVIGADIIQKLRRILEFEKNNSVKIRYSDVVNENKFTLLRNNICALFAPAL